MLKTIFIFFIGLSEEIVGRLRFLRPRNKTIIAYFLMYIHTYFEVKPFVLKIQRKMITWQSQKPLGRLVRKQWSILKSDPKWKWLAKRFLTMSGPFYCLQAWSKDSSKKGCNCKTLTLANHLWGLWSYSYYEMLKGQALKKLCESQRRKFLFIPYVLGEILQCASKYEQKK